MLIDMLDSETKPDFMQIITNLLDSPGNLQYPDCPAKPREIMSAASRAGTCIMRIRAVQTGALISKLDRMKPIGDPELLDFEKSEPFRQIAKQIGLSPAFLAHQYPISMEGPSTIVFGVKNREELYECIEAESAEPMNPELIQKIERAIK